ncbi:glutathione S-transferase N-terminal domain-containing protein [Sorangium sp. So ce341]|uniref:glutathione S-transferase N-terminal domain-containing protein n=1 Tax=Sorangium sp. So ce341 TaxID=3133302 RepID=UPI003F5D9E1A
MGSATSSGLSHPLATSTPLKPIERSIKVDVTLQHRVDDAWPDDVARTPFAALNPHRKVPVLVDGALVLRESGAIVAYLRIPRADPKRARKRQEATPRLASLRTSTECAGARIRPDCPAPVPVRTAWR